MTDFMTRSTATYQVPEYDNILSHGGFKTKNYKKKDSENEEIVHEYNIVSYKKDMLDQDKKGPIVCDTFYTGQARSIIYNENNDLICFTPPKSVDYNYFVNNHNFLEPTVIVEEFI